MDEEPSTAGCVGEEMATQASGEMKLEVVGALEKAGGVRRATDVVVDVTGRSEVVRDRPAGVWLTKDQLLTEYASKSSWVALRWSLLVLFVVCWLAMLAASVTIILMTPRCAPRVHLDWWQSAVVYQVDVQSFQDKDDDGVGDLLGTHVFDVFVHVSLYFLFFVFPFS